MAKPDKSNGVEQLDIFPKLPIEYSFGEYLREEVREEVKDVLGNSDVVRTDVLALKGGKLRNVLKKRHLKPDIRTDKVVISQISHTDREGDYDEAYRSAV